MAQSIVAEKAYRFAVRIVKVYQYLIREHQEYVLAKQLVRSGTSVGANSEEAVAAQSRSDFISKLHIALKEARETSFWLRLLHDTHYLPQRAFESIHYDCQELIRILTSILITTKANTSTLNS